MLLYTLTFIALLLCSAAAYFRARLIPLLPLDRLPLDRLPLGLRTRVAAYIPVPGGSFQEDLEGGLSSAEFDLAGNLARDEVTGAQVDPRTGLDAAAKRQIQQIMKQKRCTFDQARLILLQDRMKAAGIDPQTGLPRDSKFVTFS
ncbi:hypothetical protein PYCC9005_001172 [Savitreella phatthalungensis]